MTKILSRDWRIRMRLRLEDLARTNKINAFSTMLRLVLAAIRCESYLAPEIAKYLVAAHSSRLRRYLVPRALNACRFSAARAPFSRQIELHRCIILKPPVSESERGVLMVSFESELEALLSHPNFQSIERQYLIAFLPTWQPAYSAGLFRLAAQTSRPYAVMPALPADLHLDRELGPLCVPLPFQASSWVSREEFQTSAHKDIDLLILAMFGKYKRHWKLFEALSQMSERPRVVLAGMPWEGRTAETLLQEAGAFGVVDALEFVIDPPQPEISNLLSRSMLLLALSHKEGSFIAVAESMMSGTPVAMFYNAIIGTKAYVNEKTGFFLNPREPLGPQLVQAMKRAPELRPREWAVSEISAEVNVRRLNSMLCEQSVRTGSQWTCDIAAFHSRALYFRYSHVTDEQILAVEYDRLREAYGIVFSTFPEPSNQRYLLEMIWHLPTHLERAGAGGYFRATEWKNCAPPYKSSRL